MQACPEDSLIDAAAPVLAQYAALYERMLAGMIYCFLSAVQLQQSYNCPLLAKVRLQGISPQRQLMCYIEQHMLLQHSRFVNAFVQGGHILEEVGNVQRTQI